MLIAADLWSTSKILTVTLLVVDVKIIGGRDFYLEELFDVGGNCEWNGKMQQFYAFEILPSRVVTFAPYLNTSTLSGDLGIDVVSE